jgi:hypothetical protein
LPAKPSDVGLEEDDETEGGIISGSEESEEDSDDEALDLNALGDDLPSAGTTPPHGHHHHHHHHQHSHQVQGGGGVLSSEMTGVPQGQYGRSPQLRAMQNEVKILLFGRFLVPFFEGRIMQAVSGCSARFNNHPSTPDLCMMGGYSSGYRAVGRQKN